MPLLPSLEPKIAQLLARHNEAPARIDWSYRDFLPLEAYHALPGVRRPLSEVAYTAVETALLTEANLPWYGLSQRPDSNSSVAETAGVAARGRYDERRAK